MTNRNNWIAGALLVVAAAAVAFMIWGCATPDQKAAHDEAMLTYQAITADGVVTPEELDNFNAKLGTWKDSVTDAGWLNTLLVSLGTAAAAYAASRARDKQMWGTPESPKPVNPPVGV